MKKSLSVLVFLAFILRASSVFTNIYIPDVHGHGIITHPFLSPGAVSDKFEMVRTPLPQGYIDQIVQSPDKTWQAYMMCVPQENPSYGCLARVYLKSNAGDVYEIQTDAINPLRVFNDVTWATNDILVFDQWVDYGFHIAIDVTHQKLLQDMIILPTKPTPIVPASVP